MKTSSEYLENKRSIPLHPELAIAFGVPSALILQQIRYWMDVYATVELSETAQKRHFFNGRWWVYNSYERWQSDNFQFWSERTIQRHINELEKQGVIISEQFEKKRGNKTKWYTIDFDVLDKLVKDALDTMTTKCRDDNAKLAPSHIIDSTSNTSLSPDGDDGKIEKVVFEDLTPKQQVQYYLAHLCYHVPLDQKLSAGHATAINKYKTQFKAEFPGRELTLGALKAASKVYKRDNPAMNFSTKPLNFWAQLRPYLNKYWEKETVSEVEVIDVENEPPPTIPGVNS